VYVFSLYSEVNFCSLPVPSDFPVPHENKLIGKLIGPSPWITASQHFFIESDGLLVGMVGWATPSSIIEFTTLTLDLDL
jgi:hypothetical protein